MIWVPQYHDLGLITGLIAAAYHGGTCVFTSPITFIQSPAIFCELISRYKAHFTCGPDFGFKLMTKKTTIEQRASWDFSHLEVVMSAGILCFIFSFIPIRRCSSS